ncbi:MAG: M20/M25/M40 family metallo-hydrolase [Clostridia bacterium]|nr:M20/M25/M40 family metallo-hydrolase [Clostridia bacterium]
MAEHCCSGRSGGDSQLRDALINEFCEMARIDAESGHEGAISELAKAKLRELGFDVIQDDAGRKFGGEAGNVIGRLPGARGSAPIMLCAHLDRVVPGRGVKPVVKGDLLVSGGDTVLAADDLSGVVGILAGVRLAKAVRADLPPIEVVFTVSEERGLSGASNLDYSAVTSRSAYVLDSSSPVGTVILSSPTHVGLDVTVIGRAAHAAVNPQDGLSAIQVAAHAIAQIPFGWVDERSTANIGIISGGSATNIVCEQVAIKGEVRSLDGARASELAEEYGRRFHDTAARFGATARVAAELHYRGYSIPRDAAVVKRVHEAIRKIGREAAFESTMGGSDGNIFNTRGIETVVLGTGAEQVHSTRETQSISELVTTAELVREIILAG